MRIRTKLFLSFIFIASVSTLISFYFAINSIFNRYENMAKEEIIKSRDQSESLFYENLGELSRKGLFLSELMEIVNNIENPEEISIALELKAFFLNSINTRILNQQNKIICSINKSSENFINEKNLHKFSFFKKERDLFLRETGIIDFDEGISIVSISPIVNQDTFKNIGSLILEQPINSEFADQIREKIKAEIIIYSKTQKIGTTFLDSNGERFFPEIPGFKAGENTQQKILGDNFLLDFFTIKDNHGENIGKVIVCQNINEIIMSKKIGIRSLIIAFIIVLFSVVLLSIIIGKKLSTPLLLLSKEAEKISKGEFNVKIKVPSKDEIGNLSNIFNNMAASLKTQIEETNNMRLYLKNIIDSMPSILVGVDPNGVITQWNVEAKKITGISPENAIGHQIKKIFPQVSKEMEKIRNSIQEKQPQKMEKVMTEMKDEIHYTDIIIYPLISNRVEGAVIRMDDVTAKVRIEEMMIQTEKMMSVGGLAAGMAHEINNPLGGILLGVQNIFRRLSPNLPINTQIAQECGLDLIKLSNYLEKRNITSFLEGIQTSGERASTIVSNMLRFSRRSESKMTPINLANLFEKTIELAANDYDLKKKYDFRHIEILREYSQKFPEINCVETEIQQVILNLLKNAVQAIYENKDSDKKPQLILRLFKDGNMARIEVEDNGPGMDKDTCKRVFEPFFTTKDIDIGTGLGLSVSYFIITNNHKGTMAVSSTPGRGTKFIITLPFKKVENEK